MVWAHQSEVHHRAAIEVTYTPAILGQLSHIDHKKWVADVYHSKDIFIFLARVHHYDHAKI